MEFLAALTVIIAAIIVGYLYWQLMKENKELRKQIPNIDAETDVVATVYYAENQAFAHDVLSELISTHEEGGYKVVDTKQEKWGSFTVFEDGRRIAFIDTKHMPIEEILDFKSPLVFIDLSINPRILADMLHQTYGRNVFCFDAECNKDELLHIV